MESKVQILVCDAIKELNEELDYDNLKNPTADTQVFGGDDGIDSLSLVNLIVQLETAIGEELGRNVVLADEKAMSMRNSPFRTVGTLTAFIEERLESAS